MKSSIRQHVLKSTTSWALSTSKSGKSKNKLTSGITNIELEESHIYTNYKAVKYSKKHVMENGRQQDITIGMI